MLSSRSKILNKYLARDNLFLKKVAKFMEEYSNSSDNLLYYNQKELDDYIKASELEDSYNSGLSKGKSLGLSEGKNLGKQEIAKKLLAKGTSISEVSEITGLTKEKIENL